MASEHLNLEVTSSLCYPTAALNTSWFVTMEADDTQNGFPFINSHLFLKCYVSSTFPCFLCCFPKGCLCSPIKAKWFLYALSTIYGRAMAQAVSRLPPTADARVRSRVSPCGICGGQRQVFSPSTSVFPCEFHSTGAPLNGKRKKLFIFITGCTISLKAAVRP